MTNERPKSIRWVFGLALLVLAAGLAVEAGEKVPAPAIDDERCVAIRRDLTSDYPRMYSDVHMSHGMLAACLVPLLNDKSPYRGECGPALYSSFYPDPRSALRLPKAPCTGSPRCHRGLEVREVALYLMMGSARSLRWGADSCRVEHPAKVLSPQARDEVFAEIVRALSPLPDAGPEFFHRPAGVLEARGVGFWDEDPIELVVEFAAPAPPSSPAVPLVRARAEDAAKVAPGAPYLLPIRLPGSKAVKPGTVRPGEATLSLPTRVLGWSRDGQDVLLEVPGVECTAHGQQGGTSVVELVLEQAGTDRLVVAGCWYQGHLQRDPVDLGAIARRRPAAGSRPARVLVAGRARLGRDTLTLVPKAVIEGDPRLGCRAVTIPGASEDPVLRGYIARLKTLPDLDAPDSHLFEIVGGKLVWLSTAEGPLPNRCGEEPEDASLCDLVRDPEANDGRLVRVRATYRNDSKDSVLVDPACRGSEIYFNHASSYDVETRDDVLKAFLAAVEAHREVDVTVVGRFESPRTLGRGGSRFEGAFKPRRLDSAAPPAASRAIAP